MMDDYDDLRENVKTRAQAAVDDRLDNEPSTAPDTDTLLSPDDIVSRGWSLSEYTEFFSDCRQADYSASDCGDMWSAAKEAGFAAQPSGGSDTATQDQSSSPASATDGEVDVVILENEGESSSLTAQYLADPITDGDIELLSLDTDPARQLLESVNGDPAVPAHIVVEGNEAKVGDLEALFNRYAD